MHCPQQASQTVLNSEYETAGREENAGPFAENILT